MTKSKIALGDVVGQYQTIALIADKSKNIENTSGAI